MSNWTLRRAVIAWMLFIPLLHSGWALILVGGKQPVPNRDWPAGSERLANLPSRFAYWEGPPFGGGNFHFEYSGDTAAFQTALDAFAAIEAPRLELLVDDGATSSTFSKQPVHWEFEVWSRDQFLKLNHPTDSIALSDSPWFGQPLPAPRLTVHLGRGTPVEWSAVKVPARVTLLDCRVDASRWAASKGGVVRAAIFDMATSQPLSGATLEVGHYQDRLFRTDAAATTTAAGVALVRDLAPGDYVIRAQKAGYASRQAGYFKNYGRTLGQFDPLPLSPAASLRGRVTDPDGRPLAGAAISLMGLVGQDGTGYEQNLYNEHTTAQTGPDGRFTLDPLPRGRISLLVKKPGYYYFSLAPFSVPDPSGELKIVMALSGRIHGAVAGATAVPVGQQAYVKIQAADNPNGHWGGDKPCEPDGAFTFEDVPADTYTLTPHIVQPQRGGYRMVTGAVAQPSRQVTLKAGQHLEVNLELKP